MGFRQVKHKVLQALQDGNFQHETRGEIGEKNKLCSGEISPEQVSDLIKRSSGNDYSVSPHHRAASVDVHIIVKYGWYVKFYFLEPDTVFISVHQ